MKYGNCVGHKDTEKLKLIKDIGFDYVECNFAALSDATDREVDDFADFTRKISLPCEAANVFFKGGIPLTGTEVNFSVIEDYLQPAFAKAGRAGIKRVVFGSGGARRVPEGFSVNEAYEQLTEISRKIISPLAMEYDIIVVVEELNRSETNIINTISDAMRLVQGANRPNIKLLLDLYHIAVENDPLEQIAQLGNNIQHVHIANPYNARIIPRTDDSEQAMKLYTDFFAQLRAAGYDQRVSLEGGIKSDFASECADALKVLKSL